MNENPQRDQQPLDPDDVELDEEDFDDEDLLAEDADADLLEDDDDLLDEELAAYSIANVVPNLEEVLALDEDDIDDEDLEEDEIAEDAVALAEEDDGEYEDDLEAEEADVVPAGPFGQPGPFAAAPATGRFSRSRPRTGSAATSAAPGPRQVSVFTLFRPESNFGSVVGLAAFVVSFAFGAALIFKSFSYEPSLSQFWPLVVGSILLFVSGLVAYWTWGSMTLRYTVDRNSLAIRWGAQRQIVPLVHIERLIPADPDGEEPDIQGVDWPGHHIGKARVQQLGDVLFYSGHRTMAEVLYVQTATETYAISVPDPVTFAESIQANQVRGPLFEQRQAVFRDGIAAQSFWLDPQARFLTVLLLAAFVLVLGYVLNTYPDLTQSVQIRFPSLGGLVRVADKSELLDIPRSAAAFLGLNLLLAVVLHPWERMVSIVLLLAGISIQLALLVAAIVAVA